jgi:hypothetical protein
MNSFGTTHLKDDRFNIAQAKEMQLLLQVGTTHISYAIVNEKENRLVALYDTEISGTVEETLTRMVTENDYLHSTFSSVKASVQTLKFTFIPAQYYSRDDIPGYERLVQASDITKTFVSPLDSDGVKCVVALSLQTIAPIISLFPESRLYSQAEPMVEASLKLGRSKPSELVLRFAEGWFEACVVTEGKFMFYNIFNIDSADDFTYYLLMLMEQAKLEPTRTSVTLTGYIGEEGEVYKRIERYFENIHFADSSVLVMMPEAFSSLFKHQHWSLLGLRLCE